jgi:ribosomal-protein-alanine N-acetyltransferase
MDFHSSLEAFPRLETKRLALRAMQPSDAEALFRILSDEEVMRYYDRPALIHLDEAQHIIATHRERFEHGEAMRWGISIKENDTLIGNCGFFWQPRHQFAEIGYVLARAYWRQGIMTEALQALLHFGFNVKNLHRIEAEVILGNYASIQILRKLGFQEEGVLRERLFVHDRFHDVKLFSLLKHEYTSA